LNPGFDLDETLTMLHFCAIVENGVNPPIPKDPPKGWTRRFNSPVIPPFDNVWELWKRDADGVFALSIRGTVFQAGSIVEDVLALMINANGTIKVGAFTFPYAFAADPHAAVHLGFAPLRRRTMRRSVLRASRLDLLRAAAAQAIGLTHAGVDSLTRSLWLAPSRSKMTRSAHQAPHRPDLRIDATTSFPRELRAADAVSVQHLVVVHRDGHFVELAGECERAFVVRDRRATVASNVEAAPGYEVEKAESRADAACRLAVDEEGQFARRRHLLRHTTHAHAQTVFTLGYRNLRSYDHMFAADVHVVHQVMVL